MVIINKFIIPPDGTPEVFLMLERSSPYERTNGLFSNCDFINLVTFEKQVPSLTMYIQLHRKLNKSKFIIDNWFDLVGIRTTPDEQGVHNFINLITFESFLVGKDFAIRNGK